MQEHAAITAALGLKAGEGAKLPDLAPEPNILQELQMVEDRIAGMLPTLSMFGFVNYGW